MSKELDKEYYRVIYSSFILITGETNKSFCETYSKAKV